MNNSEEKSSMDLRLAKTGDLPQLKTMYQQIVEHMNKNGIQIWDEIYPCEFLGEDIENKRLYVLEKRGEIVSAFALCDSNAGAEAVVWEDENADALYIDRLGVRVSAMGTGIGSVALDKAIVLAKERGAKYLRLFVVDRNKPAINLYRKKEFKQAGGCYDEVIDEELTLREYGFEVKTSKGCNFPAMPVFREEDRSYKR